MNADRIDELLALAALGELTPADEIELDAALGADPAVDAELAADLDIAARLQSASPIEPPPAARSSILAAIGDVSQDDPTSERATTTPKSTSEQPQPLAPVASIDAARRRRWQPLAAAAAVAMLLVGGVIVGTRDSERSQFDTVAESSDAQGRALTGTLDGTLDAVWSPSANTFVLAGTDIPALTDAETYQLWLVDADGATPVGTFRPSGDGDVEQLYEGVDPTDFVLGVTVEPAGGSESPTLPIVASA